MIFLSKSIKIVKENERIIVFRLGRFFNILGPGIVVIIPIVDAYKKVNLNELYPGWQHLNSQDLKEKIKADILYKAKT